MEIDTMGYMLYFGYALSQVIIFRALSEEMYGWIVYCYIFIAMFLHYYLTVVYQWGDKLPGLILSILIIPTLIIGSVLIVKNRKFSLHYFIFGAMVQVLFVSTDIIVRTFSRIFDVSISRMIYRLCTPLFGIIVSYLFRYLVVKVKSLPLKYSKLLYFCILNISACLLIFVVYFMTLQYYEMRNTLVFTISIFAFLSVVGSSLMALLFYSKYVNERYTSMIKKDELESLMKYAHIIEDTYEKNRGLRHDCRNIILSFSGKSDSQVKNDLQKAIEHNMVNADNFDLVGNLTAIDNMPLKALLSSKLIHFINHSIDIRFDVLGKIQNFYMDEFDLVRLLGILLDNAFEEAEQTEMHYMRVRIMQKCDSVTFVIENSCREETPAADIMIKKGFSSKGTGRGIGLANFKEIINQYPHCSYQMGKKEKNTFFVELIMAKDLGMFEK